MDNKLKSSRNEQALRIKGYLYTESELVIGREISGSFDDYISPWKWSHWNFGFIEIKQQ